MRDELCELLGGSESKLTVAAKPPSVYMLVGLQGAGKTTTAAKLGGLLKKQGRRPLLVGCDVYRPAAIKQLEVVGSQMGLDVYADYDEKNPEKIAEAALKKCASSMNDVLILDTAGRLHIDEKMMEELKRIKAKIRPTEILLVVDAMTGQDALSAAGSFNEQLGIDGVALTKLDGDARGGAALSVKSVTGKSIKFAGMGEKLTELEPFYPDRMASRILGMGDMLTLIDKAQEMVDEKTAQELEKKLRQQKFDLGDYLEQLLQMKKMGPLENVLGMLPGVDAKALKGAQVDEKKLVRTQAIIQSMTKKERENPEILNAGRKKRVAQGSGTDVQEVNTLLRQFEQMKKMLKMFSDPRKMKKMKFPFA